MASGQGGGFSFSNFLDQYESRGSGPDASTTTVTTIAKTTISSTNGQSSYTHRSDRDGRNGDSTAIRRERSSALKSDGREALGASGSYKPSPLTTFTPPIAKALDAANLSGNTAKRKAEGDSTSDAPVKKSRFDGMTKEQKVAEIKRLKALKAAKEAAKSKGPSLKDAARSGSGSAASAPNSPTMAEPAKKPAKGSYAEILERAKTLQANAAPPAKIVHQERKVERKKMLKPDAPSASKKPRIGVSPLKKTGGSAYSAQSKPSGKPSTSRQADKRPEIRKDVKPKEKVEWSGTARATAKPALSKSSSRPSERERDRDRDRLSVRERDRDRDRSPVKKYTYIDSDDEDYESESDMEATGFDILEEEEFSRKKALQEDLEAERLEKELAARKAAARRKLAGRK